MYRLVWYPALSCAVEQTQVRGSNVTPRSQRCDMYWSAWYPELSCAVDANLKEVDRQWMVQELIFYFINMLFFTVQFDNITSKFDRSLFWIVFSTMLMWRFFNVLYLGILPHCTFQLTTIQPTIQNKLLTSSDTKHFQYSVYMKVFQCFVVRNTSTLCNFSWLLFRQTPHLLWY